MNPQDDPADNRIQDDDDDDADDEVLLSLEEGTIVEIRPGRYLFCRHETVILDGEQSNDNDGDKSDDIENIHLVCI